MTQAQRLDAVENIRNIAFLGHAGSGKTTLIDALLARAGAINAPGRVERGSTVCDFTDQERSFGHSLDAALCHLEHDGKRVNILDTPGYPDFLGRALAVLPAVETAAVVVSAQHGVESVTQRAMEAAAARRLCRLIIVNKIDAEDADLAAVLGEIRERFGRQCLPLNLPARGGQAVADCFFEPADAEPDFSSVETAHTEITDQVVELDDALMEQYLEQGQNISLAQLHDPFERALRRGHLIPVCFVSAETGAGLRQLLRVFSQLMPNPREGNPLQFADGAGGRRVKAQPGESEGHFIAHVFKITVDPYVGKLATLRVHQGRIGAGDQVYIGQSRKAVKLAHLYRVQGKNLEEVPSVGAGDFCAVAKIEELEFNDVLHNSHDEDELKLPELDLPEPMHSVAVEPSQHGQEKKLSDALHKLTAEDPSLMLEHNAQANETVLRGMGELHLRLALERMGGEYGVPVKTHTPKIAYRETVTRPADGHHRHKKQTGGAGQFGEVYLKVEPLERGAGFEFVNKIVGGSIPSQYVPAVEKGIKQVLSEGAVTGYPMQDVRVVVYDGKHHPVDSKEVAFMTAGKKAFLDAIAKAKPVVLEPIAKIEVTAPSQYVGDVTGHLSGIRGRIVGSDVKPGNRATITAEVPLAELAGYPATLKSLTGGEGSYSLVLDHYESVPAAVQKSLEEQFRPSAD